MLTQWFTLPINPEPWTIGTAGVSKTGGKLRAYIAPDPQLKAYQAAVKSYITENYPRREMITGDCELDFFFFRRLDQYLTPGGRASQRHEADSTNMQKALEDALQGVVIGNDKHVRRITSEIVRQDVNTMPGILIALHDGYDPQRLTAVPMEITRIFDQKRIDADSIDLGNVL